MDSSKHLDQSLSDLRAEIKREPTTGLAAFSKGSDPQGLISLVKTLGPLARSRQAFGQRRA